MDSIWNVVSRVKNIWKATITASEQECARRDTLASLPPLPSSFNPGSPSAELQHFRLLVGIVQDRSFRAPHGFNPDAPPINTSNHRPAPNVGIYTRVYADEIKCKKNYKFASRLISTCLGVQIVVAAALTALGAANKNGGTVTVFGAINTVIAGFLTYLKGSGLPNRIKYFQHEWSKVREYIEQRERDLQCGVVFDVLAEVQVIRNMYEAVKQDIEANQPDRFVGVGNYNSRNTLAQGSQAFNNHAAPTFSKAVSDASADIHRLSDGLNSTLERYKKGAEVRVREIGDLEKGLESFGRGWIDEKQSEANAAIRDGRQYANHMFDNVKDLKTRLEEKVKEVVHLEKELEAHGRSALEEERAEMKTAVQTTIREIEDVGEDIDMSARAAVSQKVQAAQAELNHGQDAARTAISQQQAAARAAMAGQAGAVKAAISKAEAAAKLTLAHGQAAAEHSITEHAEAVRSALARSGDTARAATNEYVEKAFDRAGDVSPRDDSGRDRDTL